MARETKRMALYEAIRKQQAKRPVVRKTATMRSVKSATSRFAKKKKDRALSQRYDSPGSKEPIRPPADGFFSKKLELSMSYLAASMLVIAQLVIVAGAVRFGQVYHDSALPFLASSAGEPPAEQAQIPDLSSPLFALEEETTEAEKVTDVEVIEETPITEVVEETVVPPVKPELSKGNNHIVIQIFSRRADLEPVKEFFDKNGIATEISERGSYHYVLVTKDKYNSFSLDRNSFDPNKDGDVALKRIREVGARYMAPSGFESFYPNRFKDAYGEKIK